MTDDDLPSGARDLITRALASLDHVELLLLLREQPGLDFTIGQLAERTRLREDVVTQVVKDLVNAGLAADTDRGIRFRASDSDSDAIAQLARAYHTRPVTLVRAIHSRLAPVKSFVEALRPRNDEAS